MMTNLTLLLNERLQLLIEVSRQTILFTKCISKPNSPHKHLNTMKILSYGTNIM